MPEGCDSNTAVTIITVALGATAVIAAAIVAAVTAHKRLVRSLSDESVRLDRQLAHDRELREVEALRKVIDESLIAIDQVRHVVLFPWVQGEALSKHLHESGVLGAANLPRLGMRLLLYMGENEVFAAWQSMVSAFQTWKNATRAVPPEELLPALSAGDTSTEPRKALVQADQVFKETRGDYLTVARAYLETRLKQEALPPTKH